MMLLGAAAVVLAAFTTWMTMVVLGTFLLIAGVMQLIYAFAGPGWKGFFLALLIGALYTIAGLVALAHPTATAVTLTVLLAGFLIVIGVFRITTAIFTRLEGWGWVLFNGVLALLLGVLIWAGWPETAIWVIGTIVGIELFMHGVWLVSLASAARHYLHDRPASAGQAQAS